MSYIKPDVAEFKSHFSRDFVYAPQPVPPETEQDPKLGVTDNDILKAMLEAEVASNLDLANDQATYTLFYLYATAHYLVMDLRAAMSGLSGSFNWTTQSKSVGSVSESYAIPERVQNDPLLSLWFKTPYGAKFMSLMLPYLSAPIFSVRGRTKP